MVPTCVALLARLQKSSCSSLSDAQVSVVWGGASSQGAVTTLTGPAGPVGPGIPSTAPGAISRLLMESAEVPGTAMTAMLTLVPSALLLVVSVLPLTMSSLLSA